MIAGYDSTKRDDPAVSAVCLWDNRPSGIQNQN